MASTTMSNDPRVNALLPMSRTQRVPQVTACDVREPWLSVVIVNYHSWQETDHLVRQLQASASAQAGAAEITIIDNDAKPSPLAARLRRRRGVSLRRWGRNHGYSRGVNEGCRLSRGEWLLLLNPDVHVAPGFLDQVMALAEKLSAEDPTAGVVGFNLRNDDGTPQLSAGVFPTLAGTLAGLCRPRDRRKYLPVATGERCRVPWVTGCCFLVRRDCLRELGGFDEDFFLYYEDVDFCRRARDAGWSIWYDPTVRVTHYRPLHLREVPAHLRVCTRHALLTYGAKHWWRWQFQMLTGVVRAEAWLRGRLGRVCGDSNSAAYFAALGELTRDLAAGRKAEARQKLDACVRDWERGSRHSASGGQR